MSSKGKGKQGKGKTADTSMKEEGKATLVPKLRFPEFRGGEGWHETALNVIACPVKERASESEEENVLSLSAEHGVVLQSEFFGKKVAGDNSERYLKIARNDFVYNDRTTKASTFGTIKRLSKYSGGIVSPIYKCFRFRGEENPVFWEWYFESGIHTKALAGLVNEGARAGRFNISITQFLSTKAWRPEEDEQQKISDCLSSLDELIAAQARQVDWLKTHREGLMQQLFPSEDETQPRSRFPEFHNVGEWEHVPLGRVLKKSPDYGVNASAVPFSERLPQYLRITDISEEGLYMADKKVSVDLEATPANYLEDGDVVLARTGGSVGKSYRYRIEDGKLVFAGFLIRVSPDKGRLHSSYLSSFLKTTQFWKWVAVTSARSGQPGLNSTEISSLSIPLPPTFPEQERIASCLSSLDSLITAEVQKLDALELHKKGLMQQLFPSSENQS